MINQKRLKELLHYNRYTGVFTWLVNSGPAKSGSISGSEDSGGYLQIGVDGNRYRAHRLAFLYTTGMWPDGEVDHVNHNKSDNRISNLRITSHKENGKNQKRPFDNKSGHIGVSWVTRNEKWLSQIRVNNKAIHLGYYDNIDFAVAARIQAEIEYGFHRNHGS